MVRIYELADRAYHTALKLGIQFSYTYYQEKFNTWIVEISDFRTITHDSIVTVVVTDKVAWYLHNDNFNYLECN